MFSALSIAFVTLMISLSVSENALADRILASFEAESQLFHQMGRAEIGGWGADTNQHSSGYMNYGPYTTQIPAGSHFASFVLMIDNNSWDNSQVVTIDVLDSTTWKTLASRQISRKEFASSWTYQSFDLQFRNEAGHKLEFRTLWHDRAYIRQDKVTVRDPSNHIINSTLLELRSFHPECSQQTIRSTSCFAAIHRKCQKLGFESGFGPLEQSGNNLQIACTPTIRSKTSLVQLNVLKGFHAQCTTATAASDSCFSAIHHYCRSVGFSSGFGPVELGASDAQVTCLDGSSAKSIDTNFDEIRIFNSDCDASIDSAISQSCSAGIHHFCQKQGFLSGFGPTDHLGNADAYVSCITTDPGTLPAISAEGSRSIYYNAWTNTSEHISTSKLTAMSIDGCNSVRFTRPFLGNYVFGRILQNTDNSCSGSRWGVSVHQLDWTNNKLSFVTRALDPPESGLSIEGGTYKITTGGDPSWIKIKGTIWVAFECHGKGFTGASATCIGPYNSSTGSFDLSRTTVLVDGTDVDANSSYNYSASVPKLLQFQGRYYVYYSSVKIVKKTDQFISVSSRGVEIAEENGKIIVKGVGSRISANDSRSVEVWTPELPNSSGIGGATDMFDIVTDGTYIYALAGVGAAGCVTPSSTEVSPCYSVVASRVKEPLVQSSFNISQKYWVDSPHEYSLFLTSPDGILKLLGQFINVGFGLLPLGQ